ncbi:MAG: regulatory protein RecX [Flavobacteriales bacterium]|jgi:regulatory protein|nr:RecX family transcriptional regulator [Flavobacteriaceae bacterium]|tara:strand:- start:1152 stop:1622 length:471 start_codon:yes stop_codon:yes gene_type:complete
MQKKNSFTIQEAQKKLEHYCAYQERCHWEVEQKLKEIEMIPAAQELIISKLIEENYLNESRFAQSFARGKFRIKKWGKQRIIRELKAKKISPYNIKLALKEISESDYQSTFYSLFEKRKESVSNNSISIQKKKILTFMVYRGWETHLIYTALNENF